MPPKKGGKKGGKKKGPAYMTHEDGVDHCAPFGFAPGDMIHTPLGLRACVLGVKYASVETLEGGVLWVRYDGPLEKEAPIEHPASTPGPRARRRDRAPVAGGGRRTQPRRSRRRRDASRPRRKTRRRLWKRRRTRRRRRKRPPRRRRRKRRKRTPRGTRRTAWRTRSVSARVHAR